MSLELTLEKIEDGQAHLKGEAGELTIPAASLPAGSAIGAKIPVQLGSLLAPADILNELLNPHDEKTAA